MRFWKECNPLVMPARYTHTHITHHTSHITHTHHTLWGSLTRHLDPSLVVRNRIPLNDYITQLFVIKFGMVNGATEVVECWYCSQHCVQLLSFCWLPLWCGSFLFPCIFCRRFLLFPSHLDAHFYCEDQFLRNIHHSTLATHAQPMLSP